MNKEFNQENFLAKLKEESKVYKNYSFILEKSENDGYLSIFFDSLKYVFQNEMSYTLKELSKMKKTKSNLDVTKMLETNVYIFKENIKIILNSCIEQIWGFSMKKNILEEFIQNEKHKNECGKITELDEENEEIEFTEKSSELEFTEKQECNNLSIEDNINPLRNGSIKKSNFLRKRNSSSQSMRQNGSYKHEKTEKRKSLENGLNGNLGMKAFRSVDEICINKSKTKNIGVLKKNKSPNEKKEKIKFHLRNKVSATSDLKKLLKDKKKTDFKTKIKKNNSKSISFNKKELNIKSLNSGYFELFKVPQNKNKESIKEVAQKNEFQNKNINININILSDKKKNNFFPFAQSLRNIQKLNTEKKKKENEKNSLMSSKKNHKNSVETKILKKQF